MNREPGILLNRMEYIKYLPILEFCLEDTISQKSKLCDAARMTSSDIVNRAALLHRAIDNVKEKLLAKTKGVLDFELKNLEKHEQELKTWISWLSAQTDISNQNVSDVKMIQKNNQEIKGRKDWLRNLQRLSEIQHLSLSFKTGELNDVCIGSLFGSVQNFSITPQSPIRKGRRDTFPTISLQRTFEFKCKGVAGNVHAIAPISGNEAWICCGWGSREIELYHTNGDLLVSVTMDKPVDHIVSTRNGNVLISSYNGNTIWRLDEHLNVTKFAQLSFIPRGMVVHPETNHVYVCGVERTGSLTDLKAQTRRHLIAIFSADGDFISDITISPHDPHRLGLIGDEGICFSDYGKNNKRQLVVMDNDGNGLNIYSGRQELENPFYPLGTQVDQYGNIIVADWNNDCVHLLDTGGQFSQYLVDKDNGLERPCALGLDGDGQLWVGDATGHVYVFSYCSW
uniref:Uncharacterized protein LOC111127649 n=1 Tax=Crassostrea virginica TaxID=6565 RepID=A0A8B8DNQ0_CRAVI|nr:uncharacterized protein LOC111127649 [Crassostrea virginica]XP_022328626.1 uncharacterized protein LOC111127649 [Crassostrea virginica]